ncbi:MAG TPA: MOSC domain-containing protein [Flexivirga sp.]|uniref:MOSC domain-containing protein n=1 Tax=Flexivirga sp. TaxID=1962927 RepID=UPI002B995286|nr:MOSC domain-containing protein [Flexivirga sp.]HWC23364.1 MOSC domain-containing protein [Flexivirga sp.]
MPRVISTNVGRAERNSAKTTPTGIHKRSVPEISVRAPGPKHGGLGSGVLDDFIGDREHHGGDDQAVYAVAREELDWWGAELGRQLDDGMFGENLTTVGLDVDRAVIGTRWEVGEAVLEVSGPRIPCGTFRMHMAERGWLKRYVAHGLSGAYLRVVTPGAIRPGDGVRVLEAPSHGVDVPTAFRAFYDDVDAMRAVLEAGVLDERDRERMAKRTRILDPGLT